MPDSIYSQQPVDASTRLMVGIAQAAKQLSMGQTKLREEVKAGKIPYAKNGNRIMFRPQDLQCYVDSLVAATSKQNNPHST
jgi:excisionase family DNA binding protein